MMLPQRAGSTAASAETRPERWLPSLILLSAFIVSLLPFSVDIAGNGVSANYSYVLIPLILLAAGIKRQFVTRPLVMRAVAIYAAIYFLGFFQTFTEGYGLDAETRRLASFWAFLFPFVLSFVAFKPSDVDIFKRALILVTLYTSLRSLSLFAGTTATLFDMKGEVGNQRFGFVLCAGFAIVLFSERLLFNRLVLLQRVVFGAVLAAGMALTFSRSTLVALAVGLAFALLAGSPKQPVARLALASRHVRAGLLKRERRGSARTVRLARLAAALAVILVVLGAFQTYAETDLVEFYSVRLIQPITQMTILSDVLEGDSNSSEGYRAYLLGKVGEYLYKYPLAGSAYRGLYLLYDEFSEGASTHNQYTDVFLRTGIAGGALWLFLLYRIYRGCRYDKSLQIGLVAIIAYGFFHETFKLSQGSFIFGMLLSFSFIPERVTVGLAGRRSVTLAAVPPPGPPRPGHQGGWALPSTRPT